MLYVQQSLGPGEELILGARFHWMYTFNAIMWIVYGLLAGMALAGGMIWLEIHSEVQMAYPTIPDHLYPMAFDKIVDKNGGYLEILWGMNPAVRFGILGLFVLGLFLFANLMITKATTEIAITTERLIYKKGLIARHVGELSIDRIEGVTVRQGILGRILGYGRVSIRGMGVGEVVLPPISDPIDFRRATQEAKNVQERGGVEVPGNEF